MGTNYYTTKDKHIGKKSAAGYYCWDCNITLCKNGNEGIHKGCHHKHLMFCDCGWHKKCPTCGGPPRKETLDNSAVGRELGFNKQPYGKKKGVTTCSSFTWAHRFKKLPRKIKDEYDRVFTTKEFEKILEECPVQYFHLIGREFS